MNYVERMAKASENRPDLFPAGGYTDIQIQHDHWCPILTQPDTVKAKQYKACECSPDIWFVRDGARYSITANGNVIKVGG